AVLGYQRLLARGHFIQPGVGVAIAEHVTAESSPVASLIATQCQRVGRISKAGLYAAFDAWCGRRDIESLSQVEFGRQFRKVVPVKDTKVSENDKQVNGYDGVSLISGMIPEVSGMIPEVSGMIPETPSADGGPESASRAVRGDSL